MWQALLAAAVAGSTGLVAKHFFNPFSQRNHKRENHSIQEQQEISSETEEPVTPPIRNELLESCEPESNGEQNDGIFRFWSSGSSGKSWSKSSRMKSRVRPRELKKKCFSDVEFEKRSGGGFEVTRRRVSVCLKKRRTSKNAAASKCGLSANKDSSLFSWGLGVGIMYMMSAGKNEISKLNTVMDETSRVVQELKEEVYRRKSLCNLHVSSSSYKVAEDSKKISGKASQIALNKSGILSRGSHDSKLQCIPLSDDGEYASSVLTEEPETELVEMDILETELESELQKLKFTESDDPAKGFLGLCDGYESYQSGGIMPSELDQKMCHLLIERQENQIEELESELQTAQSKLQLKEAELQALKDCVRRLIEFSLANPSDDESEAKQDKDITSSWNQQSHTDPEPGKPMIGMKRPIDSQ